MRCDACYEGGHAERKGPKWHKLAAIFRGRMLYYPPGYGEAWACSDAGWAAPVTCYAAPWSLDPESRPFGTGWPFFIALNSCVALV